MNSRPRATRVALLVAACAMAVTLPAYAADSVPDDDQSESDAIVESVNNAIAFNLGLGSAVGELGVTYVRQVQRHGQIELGVGVGGSGTQLSVMAKVTAGSIQNHFVFGVGPALALPPGHGFWSTEGQPVWLNVDAAGFEHRSPSGFSVTVAAGVYVGLGGGAIVKHDLFGETHSPENVRGMWFPQTRIGVGYWF